MRSRMISLLARSVTHHQPVMRSHLRAAQSGLKLRTCRATPVWTLAYSSWSRT